MTLKRILLPLHEREETAPLATAAFTLAGKFGAEVEGMLAQRPWTDRVAFPGQSASVEDLRRLLEQPRREAEQGRARAESAFKGLAGQHPEVPSRFIALQGRIGDIVARRGYYADLTVLGSLARYDSSFWRDVGDGALYHSGRPVLVVPPDVTPEHFGGRLLIAWRDSAEASRAVAAARPFYAAAEHIRIVTVGDEEGAAESAIEIRDYVASHGTDADIEILDTGGRHVAEQLLAKTTETEGTMLVMGAYSHSQWQERAFGGVTETVLHESAVPVLMAH